jgi:hypothetical protein
MRHKIDDLKRIWREEVVFCGATKKSISLQGLRKIPQNLSHDSQCPG